ncbi:uncharacterized protein LOC126380486 isoform X2 [Pectinophora gossypiella]|uniref:uncharacterized protein LOC126380486 isoform X2 n=1 Tax=Pectinophora gossypiella TaxID=13191 RepID=UPI00214EC06D|nr:uncharacterized protein LOC126380486 isoform X2 [Pectinophora gossypiella]
MLAARSLALLLLASLALAAAAPPPHVRARRQLADDNTLQPLESGTTWQRQASPSRSRGSSSVMRVQRQAQAQISTTTDGIPVFDRNKVSLDFPGNLFGPSVSLLIRTTKIIGDVIQNSAVRYQSFLRLFRPLFRGPFEIKGLDPATTTTTTTTPRSVDNEVRRRRHLPATA